MDQEVLELQREIKRLTVVAMGIGQMAKQSGENETFGRMMAVSRFLRTALNKLVEPRNATP